MSHQDGFKYVIHKDGKQIVFGTKFDYTTSVTNKQQVTVTTEHKNTNDLPEKRIVAVLVIFLILCVYVVLYQLVKLNTFAYVEWQTIPQYKDTYTITTQIPHTTTCTICITYKMPLPQCSLWLSQQCPTVRPTKIIRMKRTDARPF